MTEGVSRKAWGHGGSNGRNSPSHFVTAPSQRGPGRRTWAAGASPRPTAQPAILLTFVGRAYMPADHVTASSPVRSVGPLPYRKVAGGLESRPYMGISECSAVPVGAVHRVALTAVSRTDRSEATPSPGGVLPQGIEIAMISGGDHSIVYRWPPLGVGRGTARSYGSEEVWRDA